MAAVDFSSIPLKSVERVEIIRGGGGSLYGDGAVGGAINIITKIKIKWPENSWKLMPYAIGSLAAFWTIERVIGFF